MRHARVCVRVDALTRFYFAIRRMGNPVGPFDASKAPEPHGHIVPSAISVLSAYLRRRRCGFKTLYTLDIGRHGSRVYLRGIDD